LGTPWKDISIKNAVEKYFYVKDNCFCDKEGKSIFIYVNTVSNDLNFAL